MLRDEQDAFGHGLDHYHRQQQGTLIIERSDGLVDTNDPSVYFASYRQWPAPERQAMRLARGRVLDIGCGAGRHALYLQDKGHDVVGIDNSPLAVDVCRRRGLRRAEVLSVTRLSSRLGTFDTLLMLGNNFGLMGGFRRARWLLGRFHAMTGHRARIIAQSLDPYQTRDPLHLEYHRRNRRQGRMSGQVRLRVRFRQFCSPWFDYLLVSKQEMEEIVQDTGWKVERYLDEGDASYIAVMGKEA